MKNIHILFMILLTVTLSLLLSACANSFTDQPIPTPTDGEPAPERSETEVPPVMDTPDISDRLPISTLPGGLELVPTQEFKPVVGEVPEELLGEILSDLVEKTGVDRDTINVVRAEAVVWNDGSLGCPKPGEFYIQVLINGYWVVLEVDGVEYDYRVNDSGYFNLCEGKGLPPMSPRNTGVDIENPLVVQAKEDLAERLGISANQIALLSFEAVVWPDASLGCPQPGMAYAQVPQDGVLIRLGVGREMYFYHSGGDQAPFLCEGTSQMVPKFTPKSDELVPPPDSEID